MIFTECNDIFSSDMLFFWIGFEILYNFILFLNNNGLNYFSLLDLGVN